MSNQLTPNNDLFPETLLVSREGERIYTTSLKVAEFSGKRHKDVLKAIENKLKELPADFRRRNFAPTIRPVPGPKGAVRKEKMYEMTEEGFALTMMGFTGKEAVRWQVDFIEAFMVQRAALIRMIDRYAHVTDMIRPSLRPTVEGTEAGLDRAAIAERLGKSPASVTYHRRQARRFGLL